MFRTLKTLKFNFSAKFLGICAASLLFSNIAAAQFAATPCDPNYYESLEARAWLEAQREITQNQNLIFKPDSVLEYTCFDNHLRELADHADEMFSETTRWGGSVLTVPVAQAQHMDNALDVLVSSALSAYDNANFGSPLLGGRITAWAPVTAPAEATGTGYVSDATISGTDYACDIMQAVWMKAKCMNFIDNPAEDGFFTFDAYETDPDKRHLPTRCTGTVPWDTNLDLATDRDPALPPADTTTSWQYDNVTTYLDSFFPPAATSGCTGNACCGTGLNRVRTGLIVADYSRPAPYFYNEHVCLVPGCHWEPAGAGPNAGSPAGSGECTR